MARLPRALNTVPMNHDLARTAQTMMMIITGKTAHQVVSQCLLVELQSYYTDVAELVT